MQTQTQTTVTDNPSWNIKHLHEHLQYAADLELWTIPFYMSAMYSVIDRTSDSFQLIQSIVNQEMLHLQSAANIANAYGYSPKITPPVYTGQAIPHLDFNLDVPNPTSEYLPYSAEIGPLDISRINAMCLVEYPDWDSSSKPSLKQNVKEYANIADFYKALEYGAGQFKNQIKGGIRQVSHFSAFYRNLSNMNVTENGADGFYQVKMLINLITDQGEGASQQVQIKDAFQNTADDKFMEEDHFAKFMQIKQAKQLQPTYPVKPESEYTAYDQELLQILKEHFAELCRSIELLFAGENPEDFVRVMISVGAAIQNCWKNGVTPQFS
ncbi:ferritin-like domain-containing protein [Flavobacterium sp. UBA4197]|uniref:ferritin-like domain-containing protein n=1 Tax=Flavobacterium sp. UBA4197 TaxID=1946546 RepID=UPI00257F062F|nr:ferritin-like domain-containing protein [Flavobacterium sp. UBA4197]